MNAGARYGVLLGVVLGASQFAGPRIQAALMVLLALQSLLFAGVVWQRTRLPFFTLAGVAATIAFAGAAVHYYRGLDLFTFSLPGTMFLAGAIVIPILLAIESRVHPAAWRAWKEHMETMSFLDILKGRHIPRLVR